MNPADLSQLSITDLALIYKGQARSLSTIAHLRFARMEVTTYLVPVKLGTEGSVGLVIEFDQGDSLYFREKPGWVLTSRQSKIDGIVGLYEHLAKATYEPRLNRYLAELNSQGKFTYAGYTFHPQSRTIERDGSVFSGTNTEFVRHYNYIELKPRSESLFRKAKMQLWGGKVQSIDTLTDTDVFFALLSHFYGLRWN